jgi:hypothetical protein
LPERAARMGEQDEELCVLHSVEQDSGAALHGVADWIVLLAMGELDANLRDYAQRGCSFSRLREKVPEADEGDLVRLFQSLPSPQPSPASGRGDCRKCF